MSPSAAAPLPPTWNLPGTCLELLCRYGYDSIAAYFPAIDAAVSIGTSIETDSQTAPSDTLCFVYNALLAAERGTAEPRCSFSKESYFGGRCDCGNTYACHKLLRKCVKSELGSLSKEDCSRTC